MWFCSYEDDDGDDSWHRKHHKGMTSLYSGIHVNFSNMVVACLTWSAACAAPVLLLVLNYHSLSSISSSLVRSTAERTCVQVL